ncbi:MAG: hypothetical protein H6558_19585 [Lewinellaceae bacterium]|nr:hypothetical protein [Lewinellaceae bacterium]
METLLKSKHKTQFIFATHNPNIPVLGDCEQIFCCQYFEDKLQFTAGGIDSKDNQQNIIRIMEGGPEAFQKRTEIYAGWRGGGSECSLPLLPIIIHHRRRAGSFVGWQGQHSLDLFKGFPLHQPGFDDLFERRLYGVR